MLVRSVHRVAAGCSRKHAHRFDRAEPWRAELQACPEKAFLLDEVRRPTKSRHAPVPFGGDHDARRLPANAHNSGQAKNTFAKTAEATIMLTLMTFGDAG